MRLCNTRIAVVVFSTAGTAGTGAGCVVVVTALALWRWSTCAAPHVYVNENTASGATSSQLVSLHSVTRLQLALQFTTAFAGVLMC